MFICKGVTTRRICIGLGLDMSFDTNMILSRTPIRVMARVRSSRIPRWLAPRATQYRTRCRGRVIVRVCIRLEASASVGIVLRAFIHCTLSDMSSVRKNRWCAAQNSPEYFSWTTIFPFSSAASYMKAQASDEGPWLWGKGHAAWPCRHKLIAMPGKIIPPLKCAFLF